MKRKRDFGQTVPLGVVSNARQHHSGDLRGHELGPPQIRQIALVVHVAVAAIEIAALRYLQDKRRGKGRRITIRTRVWRGPVHDGGSVTRCRSWKTGSC